jgi:hypothetical protein
MKLHVSVLKDHNKAKCNDIYTSKKMKYESIYTSVLDLTFLLQFYLLWLNIVLKMSVLVAYCFEVLLFKIITLNQFYFGYF